MEFQDPFLVMWLFFAGLFLAIILLGLYLERRKNHRLAKWQAIGLRRQKWTWQAVKAYDALAGKHRGRSLTMAYTEGSVVFDGRFTRIDIAVAPPTATSLMIIPWWPYKGLIQLFIPRKTEYIRIWSYPPNLASRALAIPQLSSIYQSDSKPAIELKGNHLQYEQQGYFPDPCVAVALFEMLCDIAELIEQPPKTPGAREGLHIVIPTADLAYRKGSLTGHRRT